MAINSVCFHCGKKLEGDITPVTCQKCRDAGHTGMPYAGCVVCAEQEEQRRSELNDSVSSVLRDMLLLVLVIALFGGMLGYCAPVPRLKVHNRPSLTGKTWIMDWAGSKYLTRFWEDGRYECYGVSDRLRDDRVEWYGTWKLIGDRLKVTDSYDWEVELVPGKLIGRLIHRAGVMSGAEFALTPD